GVPAPPGEPAAAGVGARYGVAGEGVRAVDRGELLAVADPPHALPLQRVRGGEQVIEGAWIGKYQRVQRGHFAPVIFIERGEGVRRGRGSRHGNESTPLPRLRAIFF